MLFARPEAHIGKNCALGLEYGPRLQADGQTQDLNNMFISFFMVLLWKQLLFWILSHAIQFKFWHAYTFDISGTKSDTFCLESMCLTLCWMFTFYIVLRFNRKLEKLSKLEILEWSVLGVQMGKSRLLEHTWLANQIQLKIKDLGFWVAQKLEKIIVVTIPSLIMTLHWFCSLFRLNFVLFSSFINLSWERNKIILWFFLD